VNNLSGFFAYHGLQKRSGYVILIVKGAKRAPRFFFNPQKKGFSGTKGELSIRISVRRPLKNKSHGQIMQV